MTETLAVSPLARSEILRRVCADHQTIAVSGTSMLPTLRSGERITVRLDPPPSVGDVVVFTDHRGLTVVHRLVAKLPGRSICLGDNRRTFDPPVGLGQVVGVAVTVVDADGSERSLTRTRGRGWVVLAGRCATAAARAVAERTGWYASKEGTDDAR